MNRRLFRLTRRELLLAGIAGGAALGIGTYGGFRLGRRQERRRRIVPPREQPFAPGPFVAIDEAGLVTVWLSKTDMGQGVASALPMIIVDEMGADPAGLKVVQAPADDAYGSQLTGVSTSVRGMYTELRTAGAAAREMLVAAAAEAFGAAASECEAAGGFVVHTVSGRRLAFGALVRSAARRAVPVSPALRPAAALRYIGKAMPRLDLPAKIDGSARYGIDVRVAGMLFAAMARCPTFGGRPLRFDDRETRRVPGVREVVALEHGVAVLAEHTHAAMMGRQALRIEWQRGPNARWDTATIEGRLVELLGQAGQLARRDGQGADALRSPGRDVAAEYRLPYLAHATMEPMNCTADVRDDRCTIWAPTQAPAGARDAAARLLSIAADRVMVHVTLAGGGFGRRVSDDFVREAVALSRVAKRPVQVVWSREDDMQHDLYRPCSAHRMRARLGENGLPLAWHHRIAAPSILAGDPRMAGKVDPTAVEGAVTVPYRVPHLQVEYARADLPVPIGFWRSVGHSYNAFAVECFIDEIAAAAGRDPVLLRQALLADAPRHRAVLALAVAKAGAPPVGRGRGRGVAVHESYGSFVAMVADVSAQPQRPLAVERVVCAVDCGFAVHPDGVVAQIEGGIAYGLTAAARGRVAFEAGAAQASNFHDYPLLRFDEMPEVEVHILNGASDRLGGIGEVAVPPIGPAVCNALYAATGRRQRSLPIAQA